MVEKRIYKPPKALYHLSDENYDGKWFTPHVPYSRFADEDDKVKRVCFSRYIRRAYHALSWHGFTETYYVHVPCNIEDIARRGKLCKPDVSQVSDCLDTSEYWVKCKVLMKCIGKIRIGYKRETYRYKYNIRWLEKY